MQIMKLKDCGQGLFGEAIYVTSKEMAHVVYNTKTKVYDFYISTHNGISVEKEYKRLSALNKHLERYGFQVENISK